MEAQAHGERGLGQRVGEVDGDLAPELEVPRAGGAVRQARGGRDPRVPPRREVRLLGEREDVAGRRRQRAAELELDGPVLQLAEVDLELAAVAVRGLVDGRLRAPGRLARVELVLRGGAGVVAGDERVREERPLLLVERREGEGVRVGVDGGSLGLRRREGRVREGRVQRRHVLLRGSLLGLHCYSRHVQEGCHAPKTRLSERP